MRVAGYFIKKSIIKLTLIRMSRSHIVLHKHTIKNKILFLGLHNVTLLAAYTDDFLQKSYLH